MKTATEQLNFRVTPAFNAMFTKLASLEGGRIELLNVLVRQRASDIVRDAVKAGVLPEGTGSEPFLTGMRFDTTLAASLAVLESKMAKAGGENG